MPTPIDEPIDVYTMFGGRKMKPVKFRWHGRVYTVAEVTYTWASTQGSTRFLHFAVRDTADLFELVFNTRELAWTLAGVESIAESANAGIKTAAP